MWPDYRVCVHIGNPGEGIPAQVSFAKACGNGDEFPVVERVAGAAGMPPAARTAAHTGRDRDG